MKKNNIVFALGLACIALTSCGGSTSSVSSKTSTSTPTTKKYDEPFITTIPMDNSLQTANDKKGTVEEFDYNTYVYDTEGNPGAEVAKKALVYLPYGYDETKNYNVLYLMHGGGETYTYWLGDESNFGRITRNVLDNMFASGKADPTIVVTPTFYTDAPSDDNSDSSESEENKAETSINYTDVFQYEFRNDLVPNVEAKYATYAKSDTSPEGLIKTRDHRGYTGLSMGSLTSIRSILMGCLDITSYIGSLSGGYSPTDSSEETFEKIKSTVDTKFKDYKVNYWLNENGTADIALEPHEKLKNFVLTKWTDRFTDGKNYAWIKVNGGTHSYNCWIEGLYNSLLVFYKK